MRSARQGPSGSCAGRDDGHSRGRPFEEVEGVGGHEELWVSLAGRPGTRCGPALRFALFSNLPGHRLLLERNERKGEPEATQGRRRFRNGRILEIFCLLHDETDR
jgi:hypothetical protein